MTRAQGPGRPVQMALDVVLVLWAAWWLWAGITVAHEVRQLANLGNSASRVGQAVTGVGETLGSLPLIGGQLRGPATAITRAGQDAVASAQSARTGTRRLAILLGIAIAAVPTLPLLLLHVPRRVRAERERRDVVLALRGPERDALDGVLAGRALLHLPYRELRRVSADPAGDLAAGRHAALADAELAWLGLDRPRRG